MASPRKIPTPNNAENNTVRCTELRCVNDTEQMRIECQKCSKTVHYACTGLPAYQLNMFLNKGYRKYVCRTCCSPAKDLNKRMQEQAERIKSTENQTNNRKEIEASERLIKMKDDNERLSNVVKDLQSRCQEYINDKNKFSEIIETQFSILETKLTSKIESSMKTRGKEQTPTTESKKSFADVTKTNKQVNLTNIKHLLRSEKIEEQIEEQRKQLKESNIVIHGVEEVENEEGDREFVHDLLKDVNIPININTEPRHVSRIGQKSEHRQTRPIKIVFKDGHMKYRFMQRLKELKNHTKYAKIRITDDLTRTEREVIKEWKKKADDRNKKEPNENYVWRVRGSPRDGLYLKKIPSISKSL